MIFTLKFDLKAKQCRLRRALQRNCRETTFIRERGASKVFKSLRTAGNVWLFPTSQSVFISGSWVGPREHRLRKNGKVIKSG